MVENWLNAIEVKVFVRFHVTPSIVEVELVVFYVLCDSINAVLALVNVDVWVSY